MFKLLISFLMLTVQVNAAMNDVDKAFIAPLDNKLVNPGFENGKYKWTASAGTFTISTSSPIQGKAMGVWDAAASGNTLTATAASLKAGNIAGLCRIQVPSGTATHTLELYDGANILNSVTFESSTSAVSVYVNAYLGSDDDINLRLYANADEVSVNIDGCYLGPADGVNVGSVAQASFVGSIEWAATAGCEWTRTNASYGVFSDDAQCDDNARTVTGSVTDISAGVRPSFGLTNQGPGNYVVRVDGLIGVGSSGTTTSIQAYFRLHDGTSQLGVDVGAYLAGASSSFAGLGPGASFNFTRSAAISSATEFTLQAKTAGTNPVADIPVSTAGLKISVYKFPTSSQMVQKFDQTNYPWTSYTPTFTGFGTVSTSACFHKRQGEDLLLRCKFTLGTSTAVEARISFPGSIVGKSTISTLELAGYMQRNQIATNQYAVLREPSVGYVTFAAQGAAAGLTKKNGDDLGSSGNVFSFEARVPIQGWLETNDIGLVKHSVVTSSDGVVGVEAAKMVDGSATTTVTEVTGDWINGVCTNGSTGVYVCTINAGVFSSAPVCGLTIAKTGENKACRAEATTSTSLTINCATIGTTPAVSDTDVNIICVGPR